MPGKRTEWPHDEALLLTFQAELGQHGTVADSHRSATPNPSNKQDVQQLRRRK